LSRILKVFDVYNEDVNSTRKEVISFHEQEVIMANCDNRSVIECEQNHNLLTNFDKTDRWLYEAAIQYYGENDVFITDDAYWMNGIPDETMCALRCKNTSGDYSRFWEVFAVVEQTLIKP
jgi:hypothetical protein